MRNITVTQFFDTSVKEYSVAANVRAIPDLIDGFKPSQRKVIFGTLKKAGSIPETGMKVSQLAAAISQVSAYHHGEASLESTIVKLAQDYPGANNLNYLEPIGQFGSRLADAPASSRYIFTNLTRSFRKVFPKDDDLILKHLVEDGDEIEPERYLPLLPNVLINGANGMGTGFATNIMTYNPEDLRKYLLDKLKKGKSDVKLVPWFRGFAGTVERLPTGQVLITGKVEKVTSTKVVVTELPIGVYQDAYKEVLFDLQDSGYIKDFNNDSTVNGFRFDLDVPRTTGYADEAELLQKLKLQSRMSENLTVWLPNGKLKTFKSPEELVDAFFEYRLQRFEDRRQAKINALLAELTLMLEKTAFIKWYLEDGNAVKVSKLKKAELIAMLSDPAFPPAAPHGFQHVDKLIEIQIYNLTADNLEKLAAEISAVTDEVDRLGKLTAADLYLADLQALDLKDDLKPKVKAVKPERKKRA